VIRWRESEWENLDGMGDELLHELRPRVEHLARRIGVLFERELKRTLTGARHGRVYKVSRTGRKHVASAPGEAPAVLYGGLRNSIGHTEPRWSGWIVWTEIGTGLGVRASDPRSDPDAYARRLEFGGGDSRGVYIAPRPYMEPTTRRVEPMIDRLVERGV